MLKKSLFTTLSITIFIVAFSFQSSFAQGTGSTSDEGTIDDLIVKTMRLPALQEVGGSPFMTSDYRTGTVIMDNDLIVKDVPVKFNIFSNAIMIKKDGNEMCLESFKLVSYDDASDPSNVKHFQFAQGFPDVDGHTGKSVYQVLSNGPKAQLLKYITQKVEDASTLGDYSRKELVSTEQLYIYVPGGSIKKIKASKKDVKDALPALSDKIEEIATTNNLKMKSESDIVQLVEALNKP